MAERIVRALRAHERALARARTSDQFDRKMQVLIAAHRPHARAGTWLAAAAVLAIMLGVGLLAPRLAGRGGEADPPAAVSRLAGTAVGQRECRRDFEGAVIELDGRCKLEIEGPGLTVETWTRARIEPRADGMFVHDGLVLVSVKKVRSSAPPVRVGVVGGTIEVLGTQFVVYQGGAGGEVELMEGAIRFSRRDGAVVQLQVGDRLRWAPSARPQARSEPGRDTEPQATPHAEVAVPSRTESPERPRVDAPAHRGGRPASARRPGPKPPAPSDAQVELDAALAEISRLRAARRYDAALDQIRVLRRGTRLPVAIAELLSFEEGTLLEAQGLLGEACRHWAAHAERFPAGRYASEVERHRERFACDGSG